MPTRLDHIVIAVPDLDAAHARWAEVGLAPVPGGRHPMGTANALVRGPEPAYIELIAGVPGESGPWIERLRGEHGPVSWALAVDDLEAARAAATAAGFTPGEARGGSRTTPTGEVVSWWMCDVGERVYDPELPFLMQWREPMAPGPVDGPILRWVGVESRQPDRLAALLRAVGLREDPAFPGRLFHDAGPGPGASITLNEGTGTIGWLNCEVSTPHRVTAVPVDGVEVHVDPDVRGHAAYPLIGDVDAVFAQRDPALVAWPDPWAGLASQDEKPHEAYSRVSDAARYRLLAARADAWAQVLVTRGLARAEQVPPDRQRWHGERVPELTSVTRLVPTRSDALPLVIGRWRLEDATDAGVLIGAGEPAAQLERQPDCGCDACDDGSTGMLRVLDEAFLHALDGGVVQVRGPGGAVTSSHHGWSASGEIDAESWLAEARAGTSECDVTAGEPWL